MLPKPEVFELLIVFARLQFVQKPLKFPDIALLSALRMADRLTHNAGQNNFPFSQLSTSPYPSQSPSSASQMIVSHWIVTAFMRCKSRFFN